MKCPHVQYTMPALQYVKHALHCDFGSTSTISHSSVFTAAIIASFDSSLKGLFARCCWRSLWSACRWGWFSICRIKLWTLMLCDRFNIAFDTPEMYSLHRVNWENATRWTSPRAIEQFYRRRCWTCRTLIFSSTPIEIVFQRNLRWWMRRQILPFIQFLSMFQSFNFYNTMGWKCSLKNNCVRSCLIEH